MKKIFVKSCTLFVWIEMTILVLSQASLQARIPHKNKKHTPVGVAVSHPVKKQSSRHITIELPTQWKMETGVNQRMVDMPAKFEKEFETMQFETQFRIQDAYRNYQVELIGEGIWYKASFYINGNLFKKSNTSYAPFTISIPNTYLIYTGDNRLKIVIEGKTSHRNDIPSSIKTNEPRRISGFMKTPVIKLSPFISAKFLAIEPITNSYVDTTTVRKIKVGMHVSIGNEEIKQPVVRDSLYGVFNIFHNDTLMYTTGKSFAFSFEKDFKKEIQKDVSFSIPLQLWNSKHRVMYDCQFILLSNKGDTLDVVEKNVGFSNKKYLYHTQPMRAITIVQDVSFCQKEFVTSEIVREVQFIKTLGFNTIFFDSPPVSEWIRVCDKEGMMVVISTPLRNQPSAILSNDVLLDHSTILTQNIVREVQYHPSVIGVMMGQGIDVSNNRSQSYLSQCYQIITSQSNLLAFLSPHKVMSSPLYKYCDVIVLPFMDESLENIKTVLAKASTISSQSQKTIVMNMEKTIDPTNQVGQHDQRSTQFQAKYFIETIPRIEKEHAKNQWMIGSLVNTLYDIQLSRSLLYYGTYYSENTATTGILNNDGSMRIAAEQLQRLFLGKKVYITDSENTEEAKHFELTTIALVFLILIGLMLNNYSRLRENFSRAIFHPNIHFSNINEFVFRSDNTFVQITMMIALAIGLCITSVLNLHKDDLLISYVLNYFFPKIIQSQIIYVILHPLWGTLFFGMIYIVHSYVFVLLIKWISYLSKNQYRKSAPHYLKIWMWGNAHCVFLVVVPIIMEQTGRSNIIFFIYLMIGCMGYALFKTLRGIAIIENAKRLKFYLIMIIFLLAIMGSLVYFSNSFLQINSYLEFWNQL